MALANEPLGLVAAKQLIRRILGEGTVSFSKHALEEMKADELTTVDCTNVLRGGVVEQADCIQGSWRYRVTTPRICVVVAFRSDEALAVVTAWRNAR